MAPLKALSDQIFMLIILKLNIFQFVFFYKSNLQNSSAGNHKESQLNTFLSIFSKKNSIGSAVQTFIGSGRLSVKNSFSTLLHQFRQYERQK